MLRAELPTPTPPQAQAEKHCRRKAPQPSLPETRGLVSSPGLRSNGHQGCRPLPRPGSATIIAQKPARLRCGQLSKLAPARAPSRS